MKKGETNATKLPVWGDSLLNKLAGISRKRRKRAASKRRRSNLRRQDSRD